MPLCPVTRSSRRPVLGAPSGYWWLLLLFTGSPFAEPSQSKVIMGWLEAVYLMPSGTLTTAKLDTGAKTSSLNAEQIEHFKRGGVEWVRFVFRSEKGAASLHLESPLVRTAVIKERQAEPTMRDVVRLPICKNGRTYETEFTLHDRSNFNYPVLLGRSFLEGVALVDAAETFLFRAEGDPCRTPPSAP